MPAAVVNSGLKYVQKRIQLAFMRRLSHNLHEHYTTARAYYAASTLGGEVRRLGPASSCSTVAHGSFGGHRRLTGGELRLQRAAENFTRVLLHKAESPLTWSSRDFAVVSTGLGRPCLRALARPQRHAYQRWQRSAAKHGSCACVCTHSRLTSDLWRLCVGEW